MGQKQKLITVEEIMNDVSLQIELSIEDLREGKIIKLSDMLKEIE